MKHFRYDINIDQELKKESCTGLWGPHCGCPCGAPGRGNYKEH